jgi:hypothetical protein
MGAWGTVISSNDTFADIYDEFFKLYNDGLEVDKISRRLTAGNREIINDAYDSNNFWFALAKAQWECKQLDQDLYTRVKNIIDTGADIEVWRELDATERDLKKRKIALDKFLTDISTEKPTAKPRKKRKEPKIVQPVFQKGDCITFKLENGNYGGAVVLEAVYDSTNPFVNLIATTRINQPNKPGLKDFETSNVLIINFASWKDSINIHWFYPLKHKDSFDLFEVVGQIKVEITYSNDPNGSVRYGYCGDFNAWIVEQANRQFEYERSNTGPAKIISIKELMGVRELPNVRRWKFW